ncbi:MAG: class I SAM-dependent methyltransferase, partial [Chitinophagales bacterium]|nr:class I SAM-dependent methyltransferase [Chitinophagales bacterium]
IVINQEVIEHVADQIKLLEECFRILKKGGHLIITTPNKFYFDRRLGGNYSNQPIENILEPAQLKKLLKRCGFKIIKFTTIIPKKGDYGIYFLFDHILSKLPLVKQMIRLLKNRFLLSAHLIVVVEVNKN